MGKERLRLGDTERILIKLGFELDLYRINNFNRQIFKKETLVVGIRYFDGSLFDTAVLLFDIL